MAVRENPIPFELAVARGRALRETRRAAALSTGDRQRVLEELAGVKPGIFVRCDEHRAFGGRADEHRALVIEQRLREGSHLIHRLGRRVERDQLCAANFRGGSQR